MTDWKNWVEREMIQKDVKLEELFFWNLFAFPWWCSGWDPILPMQDIWVQSLLVHTVLSCFNRVQLCVTLWTTAYQAPLSMGFSRQEYWSGLPCPPPEDLPNPGIEPKTHVFLPALAGGFFTTSSTWETPIPGQGTRDHLPQLSPAQPNKQIIKINFKKEPWILTQARWFFK